MNTIKKICYWVFGIFFVAIIINIVAPKSDKPVKELSREKKIERQFSAWDGAHIKLQRLIKSNMADPDSYEHIETNYGQKTDHLIVITKFRGKNAFGGYVVNTIKAKVDLDGNVLKVY